MADKKIKKLENVLLQPARAVGKKIRPYLKTALACLVIFPFCRGQPPAKKNGPYPVATRAI